MERSERLTEDRMWTVRTAIGGMFPATARGADDSTDMAWKLLRLFERNGYELRRIPPPDHDGSAMSSCTCDSYFGGKYPVHDPECPKHGTSQNSAGVTE